jgi:chromosome segregation ATPase
VLDDTKTTCRQRGEEFDERMKTREGEIKAMSEAIEALEKITGVRTPESKGIEETTLMQLSAARKDADPAQAIVNLLRKAGSSKQTAALAKLADKIAALRKQTPGSGTFDQIKNMIQKMIFHLMSEQKDEDDHKNWCDKELNITEMMINDKTKTKNALDASINQLSAEIDSLTTAIKDNSVSIAAMQKSIEEMTSERQEEKAENSATVKDAQDAQTAISQAIAVLEDFYKSTGEVQKEPWELTQVGVAVRRVKSEEAPEGAGELSDPEPQLWSSKSYTGTDSGSGVIGMLTNIATDFASMEAKAKSDETSQQDNYDTEMTATNIDIAEKQSDSQQKEARLGRMQEKLTGKTNDKEHNTNELRATNKYETDLQKACVDGDSTYEERKAARTQEIDALGDAQKILESAFEEQAETKE